MGCAPDAGVIDLETLKSGSEASDFAVDGTSESAVLIKKSPGSAELYSVISELNLFSGDRQFVEEKEDEEEEQADQSEPEPTPKQKMTEIPNLRLIGTISMDKENAYAFIVDSSSKEAKGKIQKYKTGDWVGDYHVLKVERNRVQLRSGEDVAYLDLKPGEGAAKPHARGKSPSGANDSRTKRAERAPAFNDTKLNKKSPDNPGFPGNPEPQIDPNDTTMIEAKMAELEKQKAMSGQEFNIDPAFNQENPAQSACGNMAVSGQRRQNACGN